MKPSRELLWVFWRQSVMAAVSGDCCDHLTGGTRGDTALPAGCICFVVGNCGGWGWEGRCRRTEAGGGALSKAAASLRRSFCLETSENLKDI